MASLQPGEVPAQPPDHGMGLLAKLFGRRLAPATDDALPSSIYGFIMRYSLRAQVDGRLVEEGDYRTLTKPDGPLAPLMAAE